MFWKNVVIHSFIRYKQDVLHYQTFPSVLYNFLIGWCLLHFFLLPSIPLFYTLSVFLLVFLLFCTSWPHSFKICCAFIICIVFLKKILHIVFYTNYNILLIQKNSLIIVLLCWNFGFSKKILIFQNTMVCKSLNLPAILKVCQIKTIFYDILT